MSRLECGKCKSVFGDVVRVRKCPLCGNTGFSDIEPDIAIEVKSFPRWFTWQGNIGFAYNKTMRSDGVEL